MAEYRIPITTKVNDGAPNNQFITPNGGDVYVQISRGINCIIPDYRVSVTQIGSNGNSTIVRNIGNGALPSSTNPVNKAVLFDVDSPLSLRGNNVVVATRSIALPPGTSGQIDVIIGIFQQEAAGFRLVSWKTDSVQSKQLSSRFEFNFL